MENVLKYVDIKLEYSEEKITKMTSRLEYTGIRALADSLWAVKMKRQIVKLHNPIYVGFSVLDLSKLIMYNFHYNYVVPKFGQNAKLLFTDTDGLCYHVYTSDVYKDMYDKCELFDFSDYSPDHFCNNIENKKQMGKFKDELHRVPIDKFVGLRSKMYSISDSTGQEALPAVLLKGGELIAKALEDHNVPK